MKKKKKTKNVCEREREKVTSTKVVNTPKRHAKEMEKGGSATYASFSLNTASSTAW